MPRIGLRYTKNQGILPFLLNWFSARLVFVTWVEEGRFAIKANLIMVTEPE
jgi:hypothetical protein